MITIDLTIADNAFLEAQGRFYATVDSVSIIRTDTFPTLLVDPPSSPSIGPRDKLFIPIPEEAINGRVGFTEESKRVSIDEGTSSLPTNVCKLYNSCMPSCCHGNLIMENLYWNYEQIFEKKKPTKLFDHINFLFSIFH